MTPDTGSIVQPDGADEQVVAVAQMPRPIIIGNPLRQITIHGHGIQQGLESVMVRIHRLPQRFRSVIGQARTEPVALVIEDMEAAIMTEHQIDFSVHQAGQAPRWYRHQIRFAMRGADLAQPADVGIGQQIVELHFGTQRGPRQSTELWTVTPQRRVEHRLQTIGQKMHQALRIVVARMHIVFGQTAGDQGFLILQALQGFPMFEDGMHGITEIGAGDRHQDR